MAKSHVPHVKESWHACQRVMSHMSTSHVPHVKESCHTCQHVRQQRNAICIYTHTYTHTHIHTHTHTPKQSSLGDKRQQRIATYICIHTYTHTHTHTHIHTHTNTPKQPCLVDKRQQRNAKPRNRLPIHVNLKIRGIKVQEGRVRVGHE